MKNIKSQKGAISLFVVLAMLFFLAFMLGVFSITNRRNSAQLEAIRETAKIYASGIDANATYDSMIATTPTTAIPITTVEQLKEAKKLANTTGTTNYTINGKLYSYKQGASYYLANDIILDMTTEFNGKNASNIQLYDYIFYDAKGVTNTSTYKISLNNHNVYYRLSDGSLWKCIFYQTIGTNGASTYNKVSKTYTESNYAGKQATAKIYSILDNGVEEFYKVRNTNTAGVTYNYEFLLMYDVYGSSSNVFDTTKYNRWGQNNNPAKESISDLSPVGYTKASGFTTDFTNSSTDMGSTHWGGLTLSTYSKAFLDGNVGHGDWWYTVGSVEWYGSDSSKGIPASETTGSVANEVLLFVRAD